MVGQEVDHLAGYLQVVHPPVEVDPVETRQVQTDMPVEDVVHGHHTSRHDTPPGQHQLKSPAWPPRSTTSPRLRQSAKVSRPRRDDLRAASDRFPSGNQPQRTSPTRPPTLAVRGWPHWLVCRPD
jgi:hypothetical protein